MCTRLGDDARLQSGQPLDNATVNGAQSGADTRPSNVGMTGDDAPALAGASRLKVPHVGWNSLLLPRPTRLFEGVPGGTQVYFTHSFAAPLVAATAAATTHGVTFSAAVEDGLVAGVQFHAEKSGDAGLRILRNWLAGVTGARP
jgi:glutamine amidotransferase